MPAPTTLHLLGRRSAGVARVKPSRLYRTIRDRAMYSSAPSRERTTESPNSVLKCAPSPRRSKTPGPLPSHTNGSARRVSPPKPVGSQTAQTRSQKLKSLGSNENTRHHFGADVNAREHSIPPQSRPRVIRRGKVNSGEYNSAARKWVASMIAFPIFIVTSYFLFDRCMPPL